MITETGCVVPIFSLRSRCESNTVAAPLRKIRVSPGLIGGVAVGQFGRFVASQISSALFLSVLGGLFYWGHFLKWKMPQSAAQQAVQKELATHAVVPSRDVMAISVDGDVTAPVSYRSDDAGHRALTIRFPSHQAVQKAGLELIRVMPDPFEESEKKAS